MKKMVVAILLTLCLSNSFAQRFSPEENKILAKKEDSLSILSTKLINAINAEDRFKTDSIFQCLWVADYQRLRTTDLEEDKLCTW